nr:MAG TPA: hypothetical protein [Caudoviricetes sp.]
MAFTHKTKKPRPKPGHREPSGSKSTIVEILLIKSV